MPDMPSELRENIQWAVKHEDPNIYYLGRLMEWWRLEGPAKLPGGLHVEVMTHLQVMRLGHGPPDRHPAPFPDRHLGVRLPRPQEPPS